MTITQSLIEADVFTALRAFLLLILPAGTEVVQGLDNQVAMPVNAFVSMTPAGQKRLNTNISNAWNQSAETAGIETHVQYNVQLDFYGALSSDWANITQSLFRDEFTIDNFPDTVVPLYADDPMQMPLIDGEEQYEQRWKLTASMQYNPVTTITQQFATVIDTELVEIDATFKP
jgi:hypothetical protein